MAKKLFNLFFTPGFANIFLFLYMSDYVAKIQYDFYVHRIHHFPRFLCFCSYALMLFRDSRQKNIELVDRNTV